MKTCKRLLSRSFAPDLGGFALCAALILMAVAASISCDGGDGARSLKQIKKSGKLVFITRNAPTTYYEDRDGSMAGIEYEMAVDALARGEGDVAAAGLTHTPARAEAFHVGPAYQEVTQMVVCRRGGARPKKVEDLSGLTLRVVEQSSYAERLEALQADFPGLEWEVDDSLDTEQLLRQVWFRGVDCTVSDDNIFAINRRYYPELVRSFDLNEPEPLVWLMHPKSNRLKDAAYDWFEGFEASGRLAQLIEKYYGYIEIFDYVDTRKFVRRIANVLPQYKPLFEEVSVKMGLEWTLLAAQAYQESHWNPGAESPTGVRGIMMLTLPAAEDLGVIDSLDPEQSIRGGAVYLWQLMRRLPAEVTEPDRTWIALAAYNVGISHLYDARGLARQLNKNPDLWKDLTDVLPLLAQRQYYKSLKHGYARGSDPVRYVNRIRDYEDILSRAVE